MAAWPGPCRKPPVRNNLEVGRRGILPLRFSVLGGQSLYEAAVRVLLFEQKRSAGSHPLVEQQTLPQTTAPNHCYGYRCTIPRRSVPISRLLVNDLRTGTILGGLRANHKLRFRRVRQFRFVLTTAYKVKSRLSHIIMMLPRRGNIMLVRYFRRLSRIEQLRSSTGGNLLEGFANELSQGRYQWVAARKHIRTAEHVLHRIAHRNLSITNVEERSAQEFLDHLKRCRCRGHHPPLKPHRQKYSVDLWFVYLRRAGIVPPPTFVEPAVEAPMLTSFCDGMRRDRGFPMSLFLSTASNCVHSSTISAKIRTCMTHGTCGRSC
jgi:hypothetical protein